MKKGRKTSNLIRKTIGIGIMLLLVSGIGVMAVNANLNDVKIELQNGYQMTVLTKETKVSEILEENKIVLKENEKVTPGLDEDLPDGVSIKITNKSLQEVQIATISEEGVETSMDQILENYAPITEKIIVEQETIPFETITKTSTEETEDVLNKVLQEGQEGIREVTYKAKYQKEQEIEKVKLSEEIVQEPVEKIIQISKKPVAVTSRGSSSVRTSSGGGWSYSADEFDLLCALTAQEASSSYAASLAVVTCAANRAESSKWGSKGSDPLSQFKAPGQFCYSIDGMWKKRMNGNYPSFVSQAVTDCLNGARSHNYLSFRAAGTIAFGENIGGNVFFNPM